MVKGVYPKDFICSKCKWSEIETHTDESFVICTNDNTESSWPDYHNCKYYEEDNKYD